MSKASVRSYVIEEVIPGRYPSDTENSIPYASLHMTPYDEGYEPLRMDLTPDELREKLGIRWGFSGVKGVKRRLEGSVIEITTVKTLIS